MSDLTLGEHAEAWWAEQGNPVPPRECAAWRAMYAIWIDYAFGKAP
jgi:hypothetical protein